MQDPEPDRRVPNPPLTEQTKEPPDPTSLAARVQELERLCADLYEVAVDVNLPQPLLNRLWMVVAHGETPHTFDYPAARLTTPAVPVLDPTSAAPAMPMPLPSVSMTHRPDIRGRRPPAYGLPDLTPLRQRRTVLVVDDEPLLLDIITKILSRENYELMKADSGPAALQVLAARDTIDLLVTDYLMPGMTGRVLARQVRERFPSVKVLYQTGFTDMLFQNQAEVEAGAAFIEKPFTARGLIEAARLVLFDAIHPIELERTA